MKEDHQVTDIHLVSLISQRISRHGIPMIDIIVHVLFCFSLNLTHLCYALRLPRCVIHLKVGLNNHRPKYALGRPHGVDGFAQTNVNDVTLAGAWVVCSSTENQHRQLSQNRITQTQHRQSSFQSQHSTVYTIATAIHQVNEDWQDWGRQNSWIHWQELWHTGFCHRHYCICQNS